MSLELTFQIEMQSDYHVGAGYGKGTEVDSALLRDADGVPVLRGTVLNGLLRDALWRLLQQEPLRKWRWCEESGKEDTESRYCGQYAGDDFEPCPICRLFGTPRTMKRWRIGSARPKDMEQLAGTEYKEHEMVSQRVARVRVNPRTRRAAPHKLFAEEQGGHLTFTFTATCPADPARDESALDDAALLVAAARFVRQLGRSRRRGQGECLFSLTEVGGVALDGEPQEALLKRFEEHWLEGEPEAWALQCIPLERTREASEEGKRIRLRLLARLDEPLIIAQRAAAGNRFRTQPAIPGKTLRGALAARAAERFDLEDKITYDAFVDLFLRGSVDFSVLYPLFRSNKGSFYPAAPVPRDGFACKVYLDHPAQWGTQAVEQIQKCAKCDNPVKGVHGAFISLQEEPERFEPEKHSEMHIRVDPESGRVEEGQLFEYEALEAGQYFAGELTCADEEAWDLLQTLTGLKEEADVDLRLGKATRRGYGKVTLWLEPWDDDKPPVWVQQPLAERVDEGADELTLTLLTDAVVTDAWGRFATGFDDGWLSEALGFDVRVVEGRDFAATHLLDGFNTKLRLPRWRDVALRAGSTARLKVLEAPEEGLLEALARIERKGLGRRRNEGYGQVAFNHPVYGYGPGLSETAVAIPEDLELSSAKTVTEFEEWWRKTLNEDERGQDRHWHKCRGTGFLGLARWLDAHRHEPIDDLVEKMSAVGEPDAQLIELLGGAEERGDREIANRLTDKDGFTEVEKLLRRLEEKEEAHWPLGVRMLANRLAEVADREEGGR